MICQTKENKSKNTSFFLVLAIVCSLWHISLNANFRFNLNPLNYSKFDTALTLVKSQQFRSEQNSLKSNNLIHYSFIGTIPSFKPYNLFFAKVKTCFQYFLDSKISIFKNYKLARSPPIKFLV